jgi:hypothetical protein
VGGRNPHNSKFKGSVTNANDNHLSPTPLSVESTPTLSSIRFH